MAEGGGTLRELIAVFGFGVDTSELKHGETKLDEFLGKVKKIGGALAGAFAIKEIFEFAEHHEHLISQIERTSAKLGIETERVQQLQFASKSLGLESETLLGLMSRMQVNQEASAKAGSAQAEAFTSMGVSVKDANGQMKAADVLLLDVADGIAKMQDPSKQAATAFKIFGKGGKEILPFLKEGREGAEKFFRRFKELGGGYAEDAIKQSKEFQETSAELQLVQTSLSGEILRVLFPALSKLMKLAVKGIKWFKDLAKGTDVFALALVFLGSIATAFAIKMAIANLPILAMAAAFAAIFLIFEDIVTMFQGGGSLIGDTIDKLFGKGAHLKVVEHMVREWENAVVVFKALGDAITPVWDFFKWLMSVGDELGDTLADIGLGRAREKANSQQGAQGWLRSRHNMGRNAQKLLEAEMSGRPFTAANVDVLKGEDRQQTFEAAKTYAETVRAGGTGYEQFRPKTVGPLMPSQTTVVHAQFGDVVMPAGTDARGAKELGAQFAKGFADGHNQVVREAAATLPKAGRVQ